MLILYEEIKKQRDLDYLNLFLLKCLIQKVPLKYYMRFNQAYSDIKKWTFKIELN